MTRRALCPMLYQNPIRSQATVDKKEWDWFQAQYVAAAHEGQYQGGQCVSTMKQDRKLETEICFEYRGIVSR